MKYLYFIILLFFSSLTSSNPVILDPTFNGAGYLNTLPKLAGTVSKFIATALDSSGNILVVGNTHINGYQKVILARYLTTGVFDTSFNETGYTLIEDSDAIPTDLK